MQTHSHEHLATALHHHLEQAYITLAQAFQPVTWNHDLGGTWFFTNHPLPLFNGVIQTESTAIEANQLIEQITQQAQKRQAPFLWLVGPSTQPPDLSQRLEAQGLLQDEAVLGMILDLQTLPAEQSQPSGLSISPVETHEQMESWLHTLTTGFGFPEAVAQIFFHLFQSTPFVPHASCQLFLGTIDSTPVGTSLLFLDGQMAGIYAVATIPSQRRCGVGTQMTRIAVEKARYLGYTHVTLQATQMGESIYRHLGFLPVCSFQTYRWTPKHSG